MATSHPNRNHQFKTPQKQLVKQVLALIVLVGLSLSVSAQTEIKTMFYNVLNYPSFEPGSREDTLKKIIDFHPVDLLMVCELRSDEGAQRILDTVLNSDGGETYARAEYVPQQSNPNSDFKLQQTVFYNQEKLHLVDQYELITSRRDINVYEMWVENELDSDTTWLDVYVTHFKSSQGSSNEQQRFDAARVFTDHLETRPANRNVIFAGDLNLYDANESAFLELLNPENHTVIEDPIAVFGPWHANDTFDFVHSQSTRINSIFGDGAGGGLDDRFDFILCSSQLMNGDKGLKYNTGTYATLGNNRECFNESILLCQDEDLPIDVLRALFHMSDHLPIVANFETTSIISSSASLTKDDQVQVVNPSNGNIQFSLELSQSETWQMSVVDPSGRIQLLKTIDSSQGQQFHQIETNLSDGLYFLHLQSVNKPSKAAFPLIIQSK